MASNPKRPRDPNQLGKFVVDLATGETDEQPQLQTNTKASESGRKGGLRGGKARAEKLTPEERSKIAKKAAEARWAQRTGKHGVEEE